MAASITLAGCAGTETLLHAEVDIPRDGIAMRWARAYKTDRGILFRAMLVRANRRSLRNSEGHLAMQVRWSDGTIEDIVSSSRCLVRRPAFCDLTLHDRNPSYLVWAKAKFRRVR